MTSGQPPGGGHRGALLLLGWISAIKATGIALSSVALVEATRALDLTPSLRSAAASAISLAIAATAIAAGVAADRIGRRRLLMCSFVVAGGATIVVAAAPNALVYIAGQALAGIGYAAMFTGSYAYVKAVSSQKRLGWSLGLFGMYTSIITAVASLAGSAFGDANWRWLILVVPVMCVVAFALTPRLLTPMPRTGSGPVDIVGLVLVGVGMVVLISGLSQVAGQGLQALPIALLTAGGITLATWVWWEARSPHPAFPVGIFRTGSFTAAAIVGVIVNIVSGAVVMGMTDVWQYVSSFSLLGVTFGLQPLFLIGMAGGLIAGHRLSAGVSPRVVVMVALLTSGIGCLLVIPGSALNLYAAFIPGIVLIGTGLAAAITAQSQVFIHAAPASNYGAVTSSKTSIGQLGSAMGMILTVLFIDTMFDMRVLSGLESVGESPSAAQTALANVQSYIHSGQLAGAYDVPVVVNAATASLQGAFAGLMVSCALLLVATAAVTWRLMRLSPPAGGTAD